MQPEAYIPYGLESCCTDLAARTGQRDSAMASYLVKLARAGLVSLTPGGRSISARGLKRLAKLLGVRTCLCYAPGHLGARALQVQQARNHWLFRTSTGSCTHGGMWAMTEGMSACRRAYDHRLREMTCEEGDPHLFTALGIPRSTSVSWLRRGPREVVTLDVVTQDTARTPGRGPQAASPLR